MPKLLIFLMVFNGVLALAQKPFEGKITFQLEYLEFPEGKEGMVNILPQRSSWYISGLNTRIEQSTEVGGQQVILYLAKEDSVTYLLELLDRKVFYKAPLSENRGLKSAETTRTKERFGLSLQQYWLHSDDGYTLPAWCSAKHQNPLATKLPDLPGLPLEFDQLDNGLLTRYTALKVQEVPMDETYFLIPENFVRIRSEDLQKIMN